ncbi:hypothetical protein VB734_11835, partial [Synechococcus sp. BA-124 BA4]|nr:hypothetical protein [Synechococcus sp. BA-124 BA4]
LALAKAQHDALASEKDAAIHSANDLQLQLNAQAETLHQAQAVRDQQAEQLKVSQEEADLTILQLHQVQEELERYFLRSREQEDLTAQLQTKDQALQTAEAKATELTKQLQRVNQEFYSLQQRLDQLSKSQNDLTAQLQIKDQALQAAEARAADITKQHQKRSQELEIANMNMKETQEEAELTLVQLHQVQEELEHYFLRSRAGDELTQAQAHEHARAMNLLGRMIRLQATGL